METNFKKVFLLSLFDNKLKRGTRLVQDNRIPGQIPLITAGKENYGISDYISFNKELFFANSITIDMFGNAFYRNYNFFADDNILVLYNKNFSKNILLYLTSAINAATKQQFSYGKQFHMGEAKKLQITVPVTSTGELNLEYMTQYVQRIDDYLAVLGYKTIDDCKLNDKDLAVLKGADKYKEFKVNELFKEIKHGTRLIKANRTYGEVPLVTAGLENYGISQYIKHNRELFNKNSITIDMFGNTFYRNYNFYADDNIIVLYNKTFHLKTLLYFTSVIKATTKSQYSYGKQFHMQSVNKLKVSLPVTSTGEPDYDFMEAYTTAIMKKQILKVKQMLDHKLSLYQNAIK